MEGEPLVTTREAARALGVSMRALQHWARTGQIRPALVTPGGSYRWRVSDVERQLAELREQRERDE
jgi:excisionase family DNA binding protein